MPRSTATGGRIPRVSIGLPVRNGENFLAAALDSILGETYTDFEVILSDNASTDTTPEICREYASRDSRIRFSRLDRDVGAAANFNRTIMVARGEYFRAASHDDLTHPDFVRRCVEILDSDPTVVLCHSKVGIVDSEGKQLAHHRYGPETGARRPRKRFHDLLFVRNECFEVFGLIRTEVLRDTGLIGAYPVGDRVFLSELAFRGRFHEIPEYLFFSRDHPQRSVRRLVSQHERASWFDVKLKGRITFPEWRTFLEYCRAIRRSPIAGTDRFLCYLYMVKWLYHYKVRMMQDLAVAARTWKARRTRAQRRQKLHSEG